jgi:integrase
VNPRGDEILDEVMASMGPVAAVAPPDAKAETKAPRGFGSTLLRGRIWWVRYSVDGVEHRESAKSEREVDAERLLKARWKQIGAGRFVGPKAEKVTVAQLLDALVEEYKANGRRSTNSLTGRLVPLKATFGHRRASDISGGMVEAYKAQRLSEKTRKGTTVTPGTLNRELAALKRAFKLAVERDQVAKTPVIKLLEEHGTREGFVEPATFEAVAVALPEGVADLTRFAYATGWRKEEAASLTWDVVDMPARRIRLLRANSKNSEPRVLVLTGDLLALMERRVAAKVEGCPFVFHRAGQRIVNFKKPWADATKAAGVPHLLFHDLRRSAVRNLDKAGVSQSVAMAITGHKTTSVYQRYRIVDEGDIEQALTITQAATRQAPAVQANGAQ